MKKIQLSSLEISKVLSKLAVIDIYYTPKLECITIESSSVKEINIQSCTNLKKVKLNDRLNNLSSINISNVPLCEIRLETTWTSLKELVLVGTDVKELYIPKECIALNFINVSGCPIESITYDRKKDNFSKRSEDRETVVLCYYITRQTMTVYKREYHEIFFIPSDTEVTLEKIN